MGRHAKAGERAPTTEQLRHAIDRGRAGDKVSWPDPAAAPLGTDDEAPGASPGLAEIERSYLAETGRPFEHARGGTSAALWIGLALAFVAVVTAAAWIVASA